MIKVKQQQGENILLVSIPFTNSKFQLIYNGGNESGKRYSCERSIEIDERERERRRIRRIWEERYLESVYEVGW